MLRRFPADAQKQFSSAAAPGEGNLDVALGTQHFRSDPFDNRIVLSDYEQNKKEKNHIVSAVASSVVAEEKNTVARDFSASVNSKFAHEPLDLHTRSIRLAKTHSLEDDDIVKCTVKPYALNGPSVSHSSKNSTKLGIDDYTCLSYVWGPSEEERDIVINGQLFRVRSNLFDFLHSVASGARSEARALAGLDSTLCNLWWWIDAICIDQCTLQERNHQVQQMGRIYSSAQSVVSWLGKEPYIASLFDFTNRFASCKQSVDRKQIENYFLAVVMLVTNTYWTRAWITQEIYLARDSYLLAEGVSVSTKALYAFTCVDIARDSMSLLQALLEGAVTSKSHRSLLENLWLFGDKRCANRRDLVYSILSISQMETELVVDYAHTLADLAYAVLKATGTHCCLCRIYLVFETLKVDYGPRPFAEVQSDFRAVLPSHVYCAKCSSSLGLGSCGYGLPIFTRVIYVFCLSCDHSQRSTDAARSKRVQLGHMILVPKRLNRSAKADLFWVSASNAQAQKPIESCIQLDDLPPEYLPDRNAARITLSCGTIRSLINVMRRDMSLFQLDIDDINNIAQRDHGGWRLVD